MGWLSKILGIVTSGASAATGFPAWVGNLVLNFVWKKLVAWWKSLMRDKADQKEAAKEADDDMKKAEAITPESSIQEQKDAAKDALKHL
jgi:hypothetical protein